jgi:hypothetical protein
MQEKTVHGKKEGQEERGKDKEKMSPCGSKWVYI